jgi:hypothetical protein
MYPGLAAADQLWQVDIDITLQGNGSCGGTCVQTIDASFLYDGQFDQFGGWVFGVVPGSVTITGSGPLGATFGTRTGADFPSSYDTFLPIFDNLPGPSASVFGDEIDIFRPAVGSVPVAPSFLGVAIYRCGSSACFNGFATPGTDPGVQTPGGVIGYPFWVIQDESFSYTVKAVPEPSTLAILLSGLALLAGLTMVSRRK